MLLFCFILFSYYIWWEVMFNIHLILRGTTSFYLFSFVTPLNDNLKAFKDKYEVKARLKKIFPYDLMTLKTSACWLSWHGDLFNDDFILLASILLLVFRLSLFDVAFAIPFLWHEVEKLQMTMEWYLAQASCSYYILLQLNIFCIRLINSQLIW